MLFQLFSVRDDLILKLHTSFALDYCIAAVQRHPRLRSGLAFLCIANIIIGIFLYRDQGVSKYYPHFTESWRYRDLSDNCSQFQWKSNTQLERASGFSVNTLFCIDITLFFWRIILQRCCSSFCSPLVLSASLEISSLALSVL